MAARAEGFARCAILPGKRESFEVWIEGTIVYTRGNVMTVDDRRHLREARRGEAWTMTLRGSFAPTTDHFTRPR